MARRLIVAALSAATMFQGGSCFIVMPISTLGPNLSLRGGAAKPSAHLALASGRRAPTAMSMSSSVSESSGSDSSSPSGPATAYAVAGVASLCAWLVISYTALSFHPTPSINAACGLRHNALTMAQAWALPLPLGWAVFSALHSAASVGWDRLRSATYR